LASYARSYRLLLIGGNCTCSSDDKTNAGTTPLLVAYALTSDVPVAVMLREEDWPTGIELNHHIAAASYGSMVMGSGFTS
jgi:hypothetical protein